MSHCTIISHNKIVNLHSYTNGITVTEINIEIVEYFSFLMWDYSKLYLHNTEITDHTAITIICKLYLHNTDITDGSYNYL